MTNEHKRHRKRMNELLDYVHIVVVHARPTKVTDVSSNVIDSRLMTRVAKGWNISGQSAGEFVKYSMLITQLICFVQLST